MDDSNQLSIQDLIQLKEVIDIACQRGAFRAAEMSTVGIVFNRLEAFLASVIKQAQPQPDQTPKENTSD